MGHTRLDHIPTTKKWAAVVDEIVNGVGLARDDVARIAALTLTAAAPALEKSKGDAGLRHTFYLLTQIVLAAREPEWQDTLARAGVAVSSDASLFDVTSAMHAAVDDHLAERGHPTDISEMAQQAAGEALAELAGSRPGALFEGGGRLQVAIRDLSTKAGFSRLGQVFFGPPVTVLRRFVPSATINSTIGFFGDFSDFIAVSRSFIGLTRLRM